MTENYFKGESFPPKEYLKIQPLFVMGGPLQKIHRQIKRGIHRWSRHQVILVQVIVVHFC